MLKKEKALLQCTQAGNIMAKDVNEQQTSYEYDADIMTKAGATSLTWDENGRLTQGLTGLKFYHDWDGRLTEVYDDSPYLLLELKTNPMGHRVERYSCTDDTRQYIVDISGKLPTILCESKKTVFVQREDRTIAPRWI